MSILVAKHINSVLSGDEQLSQAVGDRIYLEGIKNETQFPYIIFDYDVSPDSENSTKDGDSDVCNVVVGVYSDEPIRSLEIAERVREVLSDSEGDYGTFQVDDTVFDGYEGYFDDGFYLRILRFNIYTSK